MEALNLLAEPLAVQEDSAEAVQVAMEPQEPQELVTLVEVEEPLERHLPQVELVVLE